MKNTVQGEAGIASMITERGKALSPLLPAFPFTSFGKLYRASSD